MQKCLNTRWRKSPSNNTDCNNYFFTHNSQKIEQNRLLLLCIHQIYIMDININAYFENEWAHFWFEFAKRIWIRKNGDTDLNGFCRHISRNKNLTMDMIFNTHKSFFNSRKGYEYYVSGNPNVTIEFVYANPSYKWNWRTLCGNPNITPEIIETHLLKMCEGNELSFHALSYNPNLTMDIIMRHLDKPWTWCAVSRKANISIDDIINHPEFEWSWFDISNNPNVTIEIIKSNITRKWNWRNISKNPSITYHDVVANPDLPWYYECFPYNPSFTFEQAKHFIPDLSIKYWKCRNIQRINMKDIDNPVCGSSCISDIYEIMRCEYPEDKQMFIASRYAFLLLATIHEYYMTNANTICWRTATNLERIFADNYLVKKLASF